MFYDEYLKRTQHKRINKNNSLLSLISGFSCVIFRTHRYSQTHKNKKLYIRMIFMVLYFMLLLDDATAVQETKGLYLKTSNR